MAFWGPRSAWVVAAEPPYDPGPTLEMYGQLAATLAGFAFGGLVLYLGREAIAAARRSEDREDAGQSSEPEPASPEEGPGAPNHVAEGLFYAMASLVVMAFLYATLSGEDRHPLGGTLTAMLAYGIGFGLAVLSVFYAVTLMMIGHAQTSLAARRTIWVIVVVGPLVVMRFLAGVASEVWEQSCGSDCPSGPWVRPHNLGGVAIVGLFVVSNVLIWDQGRWLGRLWLINRIASVLRGRPMTPVWAAFLVAATLGVASLWLRSLPGAWAEAPPMWVSYAALGAAVILLGFFAVAVGSVLGPEPPPSGTLRHLWREWRQHRRDRRAPRREDGASDEADERAVT